MKHNVFLFSALLAVGVGQAQITYNNLISTIGEGTIVIPTNEITDITVDPDIQHTLIVNMNDSTQKQLQLGTSGTSNFTTISADKLLQELYSYQYYGLPYNSRVGINSASYLAGKFDALTDLYQMHWDGNQISKGYYGGTLTSQDDPLMSYTKDAVWESVNKANELIYNLNSVNYDIVLSKDTIAAEAKCIIAMHYFDLFMHYGGLPILTGFDPSNNYHMGSASDLTTAEWMTTYADKSFEMSGIHNRCSLEETVDYMVNLIDAAIPYLNWRKSYVSTLNLERKSTDNTGGFMNTGYESRRWTRAAAMALKAKILLFAASPIFNDSVPYYSATTPEQSPLVWYGGYDSKRWEQALEACKDFFDALSEYGCYELTQSTGTTSASYRQAYRKGYILTDSDEVLMNSRVTSFYGSQATYNWFNYNWKEYGVARSVYSPTEEYAEMFGWSDGTPFKWEEDSIAGKVDGENGKLFYEYKAVRGGFTKTATRDPRLYENLICNGQQEISWVSSSSSFYESGNIYELWRGGYHAGEDIIDLDGEVVENPDSFFPTGYGAYKYVLSKNEFHRNYNNHWVSLSLSEMYLMYAEALAQNDRLEEAIQYVDVVRNRVGLGSLATCYLNANGVDLTTDKDLLIDEILKERACELGMTNNRFYDMVRYKRTDWMTQNLHGLAIQRYYKDANNEWVERAQPYLVDDKNSGFTEPTCFKTYRFELKTNPRALWAKDKDSNEVRKWLLSPLPQEEIDKGLGLIQNPGW